jgi:lipoprotein signal peptidase
MRTLLTALTAFAACQAARKKLDNPARQDAEYAGGRVKLTALRNEGAAFGLPIPRKAVLGVSAAALALLWTQREKTPVAAGLVLGGGLSNLLERVKNGAVYDYVQFPKAPKKLRDYVFNLADFAVFSGAVGLLLRGKR